MSETTQKTVPVAESLDRVFDANRDVRETKNTPNTPTFSKLDKKKLVRTAELDAIKAQDSLHQSVHNLLLGMGSDVTTVLGHDELNDETLELLKDDLHDEHSLDNLTAKLNDSNGRTFRSMLRDAISYVSHPAYSSANEEMSSEEIDQRDQLVQIGAEVLHKLGVIEPVPTSLTADTDVSAESSNRSMDINSITLDGSELADIRAMHEVSEFAQKFSTVYLEAQTTIDRLNKRREYRGNGDLTDDEQQRIVNEIGRTNLYTKQITTIYEEKQRQGSPNDAMRFMNALQEALDAEIDATSKGEEKVQHFETMKGMLTGVQVEIASMSALRSFAQQHGFEVTTPNIHEDVLEGWDACIKTWDNKAVYLDFKGPNSFSYSRGDEVANGIKVKSQGDKDILVLDCLGLGGGLDESPSKGYGLNKKSGLVGAIHKYTPIARPQQQLDRESIGSSS